MDFFAKFGNNYILSENIMNVVCFAILHELDP